MKSKKDQVCTLLKGIEKGDPKAVTVVNESMYIQHNPLTKTGNVGLAELFLRLSKTNPKVEIIRVFEDGDYVFAHTDYDFNVVEVGFEMFRFEDGLIVEHWDNLELKPSKPNASGHTMLSGTTEVYDLDKTEINRKLVQTFVTEVLVNNNMDKLDNYVNSEIYIEHNRYMSDGLESLRKTLTENEKQRKYETVHRVLAEGSFVLSVTEGYLSGVHNSFYDLFRIENGLIVEHWDTVNEVPPRNQWVNNNGKF